MLDSTAGKVMTFETVWLRGECMSSRSGHLHPTRAMRRNPAFVGGPQSMTIMLVGRRLL